MFRGCHYRPQSDALPSLVWQFGGLRSPATGKTVPRWISAGRDTDERQKHLNGAPLYATWQTAQTAGSIMEAPAIIVNTSLGQLPWPLHRA